MRMCKLKTVKLATGHVSAARLYPFAQILLKTFTLIQQQQQQQQNRTTIKQ
jgi:hypothetical protein